MSDACRTAEERKAQLIQEAANRRVEPYIPMLHTRIAQLTKALYINTGDLAMVFPESDWEGVDSEERPIMLFGCRIVYADVPSVMVAVPAPAGPVAILLTDAETGEQP